MYNSTIKITALIRYVMSNECIVMLHLSRIKTLNQNATIPTNKIKAMVNDAQEPLGTIPTDICRIPQTKQRDVRI